MSVSGANLVRDGQPWIPHGFNQIAFVLPPGVPATKPLFSVAAEDWTPLEYVGMRLAGADSVRIQIAQTRMDPDDARSTQAFRRLLAAGWVDALGTRFGEESVYTFWPYLRDGWSRNAGLRLDHLLVSPSLAGRVEDAGVDREVRAEANASDHAPAWVRLRDDAASVGRRRALRGSAKAR